MKRDKHPENPFKVPKKQWRKWTVVGKHVFNKLFKSMTDNPEFYRHTKAGSPNPEEWRVTAWNSAWMAADIASRGEQYLLDVLTKEIRGTER